MTVCINLWWALGMLVIGFIILQFVLLAMARGPR